MSAPSLEDKLLALLENDDRFRRTWNHQRSDLRDQSLSPYDMALMALAIRRGGTTTSSAPSPPPTAGAGMTRPARPIAPTTSSARSRR
jgi:hypothetical protein